MSLKEALKKLKALTSLLTTLPLGSSTLEDAARAFYLVPLLGLLEGVLLSSILILSLILGVNHIVSGALFTLAHVMMTGGLHLDGFSDYSDVIGARAKGDRAISILKDPHRGSFAILALTLNLIITTALASQLYDFLRVSGFKGGFIALLIIILSYILSTESLYLTLLYSEIEPYEGMVRVFSIEAKRRGLKSNVIVLVLTASIPITFSLLYIDPLKTLLLVLLTTSSTIASVTYTIKDSASRIGYANGDIAGFSYELSRLSTLGVSLVVLRL